MALFGRNPARTGIDIGTHRVKLVRGVGARKLERISHVGLEEWDPEGSGDDDARAAGALIRLLDRLALNRTRLGRIAVGAGAQDASFRDVISAPLTEKDLRTAIEFEAKKHLDVEHMVSPVLSAQVLGSAPPQAEGGPEQTRVLYAAIPKLRRDFALRVLARLRLDPEVVDLEPLASLNAVLAQPGVAPGAEALALLDLGGRHATLQVTSRTGGVLGRLVGRGAPSALDGTEAAADFARHLVPTVRETLTHYRGRHRREVGSLLLCGSGAYLPELPELLCEGLGMTVSVADPLAGLADAAEGNERAAPSSACFVTACGLCRWWDEPEPNGKHVSS